MKAAICKICSLLGLTRLAGIINRRKASILMYHGITRDKYNADWTQVHEAEFKMQMEYISARYHIVTMDELIAGLENNSLAHNAVAVTFDDGYRSNYTIALPVLKALSIPATIFVTSSFIPEELDTVRFLWPDYMSALLNSKSITSVDLTSAGMDIVNLINKTTRLQVRKKLVEKLKLMPDDRRNEIIADLRHRYDAQIVYGEFPDYFPMTENELARLAAEPLITIGAHTINHPILSRLDKITQEIEITDCRTQLEAVTGKPVTLFAYPNGRIIDVDTDSIRTTEKSYQGAVLTEPGQNAPGHNKYLLRRIGVGKNTDPKRLNFWLSGMPFFGQKTWRESRDILE